MTEENPIEYSIKRLQDAGWTEEQATYLVQSLRADTPEKLWEAAPKWVEHCFDTANYMNNLLGLVAMGLMDTHLGDDGKWYFQLNKKGSEAAEQLR